MDGVNEIGRSVQVPRQAKNERQIPESMLLPVIKETVRNFIKMSLLGEGGPLALLTSRIEKTAAAVFGVETEGSQGGGRARRVLGLLDVTQAHEKLIEDLRAKVGNLLERVYGDRGLVVDLYGKEVAGVFYPGYLGAIGRNEAAALLIMRELHRLDPQSTERIREGFLSLSASGAEMIGEAQYWDIIRGGGLPKLSASPGDAALSAVPGEGGESGTVPGE